MKSVFQYLLSTIRHKWFVLVAGLRIVKGIPLMRLLLHDLSKFNPVEFLNYAKYYKVSKENRPAFMKAWMHHQKRNKHHPEYWTSYNLMEWASGAVEMPDIYVREMVADLLGASKEYTGDWDMSEWLKQNITRWNYCDWRTLDKLVSVLREIGYPVHLMVAKSFAAEEISYTLVYRKD